MTNTTTAPAQPNTPLPEGWVWTTLDQLAETIGGVTKGRNFNGRKTVTLPYLRVANVQRGWLNLEEVKEIEVLEEEIEKYSLHEGDLLLTEGGDWDKLGRSAIWKAQISTCIHQNHIFRARKYLPELPSEWLLYYTNSEQGQAYFSEAAKQTTNLASINLTQLRACPIPLPPLPEQHRIVAAIEQHFTRLDAGVAALKRAQANLRRYKAAVLKAACEGQLVPQDPSDEPAEELLKRIEAERGGQGDKETRRQGDKGRGTKGLQQAMDLGENGREKLPELPRGWVQVKLNTVAEVRLGRQRSPSRAEGPNMRPYMRAANVTWRGIDLSDVKEMDFSPQEVEIYRLKIDDILLSEASGSSAEVGKPALWKEQIPDCCFQNTLIRVRSLGPLPAFLYVHFLQDALLEHFGRASKGVGIHHLSAETMSNWLVRLPPLPEQHRIVVEVERRLSVVQELEATLEANLARAERLRQAILKQAFEGKLAPQDPNDEPASVLLERIREERTRRPGDKETRSGGQQQRLAGL